MNKQFNDSTKFWKYSGLKWSGILKSIKKSSNPFQPIFEAFTNSLEAIRLRGKIETEFQAYIKINLNFRSSLVEGKALELLDISIEDNGIGFDNTNYARLKTFKDDTKGFNNRGSGRIQMIHFFKYVSFESVYAEKGLKQKRKFTLSSLKQFVDKNTILYEDTSPHSTEEDIRTIVRFVEPLGTKESKAYQNLQVEEVKKALLAHYLLAFCSLKPHLPQIEITYTLGEKEKRVKITPDEIPDPTHQDVEFSVPFYQISADMKRLEKTSQNKAVVQISPYKISSKFLTESGIKVTSKGEVSGITKVKLTCIDPEVSLDGYRYLFLLKSDYFDSLDGDERGNIEILDKTEFKKRAKSQGYIDSQIILNDIEDEVNRKARDIYDEISKENEQFDKLVEKLQKDYLLSKDALKDVSISDGIDGIFRKAYISDAQIIAKQNAEYVEAIQGLDELDPSSEDYQVRLSSLTDQIVGSIPLQNRVNLSKYVVRRKMVIELMGKILNRSLTCQQSSQRNIDEKLLHNLIFKQHSSNPLSSDLWLVNEEYMYFKGTSETLLSKLEIDGKRVFKDSFKEEEERYLTSLGQDRLKMRTDVLLFPSEGKCVIIEFKNPNVNVANCLNQVSKYAYFLRNFCNSEFKFLAFYGYLIGENIENRDIRAADGDFKPAPNLDYLFRPAKPVVDESGRNQDGSLYMEVIRFSVLKERAELRNKAFMEILKEESEILGEEEDTENKLPF